MTIIHGDNQTASRQFFITLKDQAKNTHQQIVDLSGESIGLNDLVIASQSTSLLEDKNSVFIEGFFSRRPSNDKKAITAYLVSHPDAEITLWDGKDVTSQLKNFPPPASKKFDLPKKLWQFLDTLSLNVFRQTLTTTEPEMLLALLASRLRQLIIVKDGVTPIGQASWQVGKLKSQAAKFSLSQLYAMHSDLLDLDYKQKTSFSASDLSGALELWLVQHVQ